MPLSEDPAKQNRQLANLRQGNTGNGQSFTGSNTAAVSHGAYAAVSADRLDRKVAEVAAALSQDAPVRDRDGGLPAADGVVVRQLAEALCRLESVGDFLSRRGWQDDKGNPRPVLDTEARLRSQVLDLLRELGMTPASRAKLGLDLARGLTAQEQLEAHLRDRYGDGGES